MHRWAIVLSAHLSGYGLVRSLRASGWDGSIVCLQVNETAFPLAKRLSGQCRVESIRFAHPRDLLDYVLCAFPKQDHKYLFLTDERYHRILAEEHHRCDCGNIHFKLGSRKHLETILDRLAFYDALQRFDLAAVPETITSEQNPWETFGRPFFLRLRETWNGMVRRPRNQPIYSPQQLVRTETKLAAGGMRREEWCYQEMLCTEERANVSVCGWHDRVHQDYIVTRKVLQHPQKNGNGDVVERIEGLDHLTQSTRRVLDHLEFDGPFELEFVLDKASKIYKVIELNPRFWLQHNLADACLGLPLVSRCTERSPVKPRDAKPNYWVNGIYATYRLARLDLRVLPYLFKSSVKVPSITETMLLLPRLIFARMIRARGKATFPGV